MVTCRPALIVSSMLLAIGVAGCATGSGPSAVPRHDNADAVVWLQTSAEYAAVTSATYAAATAALEALVMTDPASADRMAVVLDVDETVLDNSRYQAQLVLDDASYGSDTWDQWLALRAAPAVPGAVEFINRSQALGVHVALITNRRCRPRPGAAEPCPQKTDTLVNLDTLGVEIDAISLFLRGDTPPARCRGFLADAERVDGAWSSNKQSRRDCVNLDRDIVMLFGDQLGDFTELDAPTDTGAGRDLAADYRAYWGSTWFMLPNPTYGDWRPRNAADKRAIIRGID